MPSFRLDWDFGPGVQLDLTSPPQPAGGPPGADRLFQLKYSPPLRSAIRTLLPLPLTKGDLDSVDQQIDALVKAVNARARSATGATNANAGRGAPGARQAAEFQTLGDVLFNLVVAPYIAADLRLEELFVEIGVDEDLLGYPWELMHDGETFLCLRHYLGRFINSTTSTPPPARVIDPWGNPFKPLTVLVVSVPLPMPRNGLVFEPLPSAEAEADAIVKTLADIDGVEVFPLRGKDATYAEVFKKLKSRRFHIIHYCGHAVIDNVNPRQSCLILHDRSMNTGPLTTFVAKATPILCFINACETAQAAGGQSFNFYGLARAFLDTGAYLLGSRWKIGDGPAAEFANAFYTSLLGRGDPLGKAVHDARTACSRRFADEFAWASYILYGDPRVRFHRDPDVGTPGPSGKPASPGPAIPPGGAEPGV